MYELESVGLVDLSLESGMFVVETKKDLGLWDSIPY